MHHKKKRTRYTPKSQYTVIAFLWLRVGTVPFGATVEACAETADCSAHAERCADLRTQISSNC